MPKAIKGVEIFSAGTWNEETYTVEDLNEMVRAFNENAVGARPHLKIGHDPKQVYAKSLLGDPRDGAPAAGWIEKLYVSGEKLVADFSDIPEKLYSLIKNKAYRKVSSEIFHNIKIGEKSYRRMLAAVALLGADNPGVMNLSDILSNYSVKFDAEYEKVTVSEVEFESASNFNKGVNMPTENEIKLQLEKERLEQEAAAKETELKEFRAKAEAEKAEADKELADLREFKAKAAAEKAELEAKAEAARVETFATELVSEKLCSAAMKPLVIDLLGPEKKEYSMKAGDKETKLTKAELLKETLKLFKAASEVNFEERSSKGDEDKKEDNADVLDKAAKEYATKHGVTYGAAMKAVMREQNQ